MENANERAGREEGEKVTRHWTEILVERIMTERKQPFVITGGITTSGPTHLGTVCEFLYPAKINDILVEKGQKSSFYFIGDILDAFDSVPSDMEKYGEQLKPYLGMPLCNTPDPLKCHVSLGDHYLADAEDVIKKMGLTIKVIRVNELYQQGKFDPYARIFLKNEQETRRVVAETSFRKVEELAGWSPIMPICEKCGRIATTRVTWHDDEEYEYIDDGDTGYVKGCGYSGRAKISDHRYKLQWRVHWPSWQALFNTTAEGGGKDHFTRGGSYDTQIEIHRRIFNREPPVAYNWGFILFEGKKYSKSKGIGMGTTELLKLIPPEVIAYILIEPDLKSDKNIAPSGEGLLAVYEEIERISVLGNPESRADKKKAIAFRLAIGKLKWKAKFVDILTYYQIHRDWKKVGSLLGDESGVAYLAPYIEEWLARKYEPERYNFSLNPGKAKNGSLVGAFDAELADRMNALEIHNLVYSVAEKQNVKAAELFGELYRVLIGKDSGPRFGKLIEAIGVKRTKELPSSSL